MTDESVAIALRSGGRQVVIEAPAGCGKTYQAAEFAKEAATQLSKGQKLLILTHTHAACSVFTSRTSRVSNCVEIGTIDSLIAQIATAYHRALDLPVDVSAWVYVQGDNGFNLLAQKVCALITRSASISGALVARFPIVICDEHQDASEAQHGVVLALGVAGARLLIFADPMQAIYGTEKERAAQIERWAALQATADVTDSLDRPHRWDGGSPALGEWILDARRVLQQGGAIDLRGRLPAGLRLIEADNQAERHGNFQVALAKRREIDGIVRRHASLLVLSPQNDTVRGLNAFWARQIPIWEGFTRNALGQLTTRCRQQAGDAHAMARAFCDFVGEVGIGFTATGFCNRLLNEVKTGCATATRGKPVLLQQLALCFLQSPDHIGMGNALNMLSAYIHDEPAFHDVKIDLRREFREARHLADFENLEQGLMQLNSRRSRIPPVMPRQAISSIHKAKGLECLNALILPCDRQHFASNTKNRCLLYVALSRASTTLTLVLSPLAPTTLFRL